MEESQTIGTSGMTAKEITEAFGGGAAVARALGLKQPSVHRWTKTGVIPRDKLVALAPKVEKAGIATRKQLFPTDYADIWPELAPQKKAKKGAQ